jgi:hypothetical protein
LGKYYFDERKYEDKNEINKIKSPSNFVKVLIGEFQIVISCIVTQQKLKIKFTSASSVTG